MHIFEHNCTYPLYIFSQYILSRHTFSLSTNPKLLLHCHHNYADTNPVTYCVLAYITTIKAAVISTYSSTFHTTDKTTNKSTDSSTVKATHATTFESTFTTTY